MANAKTKRPARQQRPARAARQAHVQATLFNGCMADLRAMRERLRRGDCPATITEPERRAAVVDLERALAQLANLERHYVGRAE